MNSPNIASHILKFVLYISLQVFFLKNVALFDVAIPFLYVMTLITLPFDMNRILLLVIGFSTGLIIDIFYNTLGMHAAASTIMMFLRKYPSQLFSPRGGYDQVLAPGIQELGLQWFTAFSLPLIFLHHFALFMIEASDLDLFFNSLGRAAASTLFTFFMIILAQYLFHVRRKRQAY